MRDGKDARVDDDFAPRQTEGVDLIALDHVASPLEVGGLQAGVFDEIGIAGGDDELFGEFTDNLDDGRIAKDVRLRQNLVIRLCAESRLLLRIHSDDLVPSERPLLAAANGCEADQGNADDDRQQPQAPSAGRVFVRVVHVGVSNRASSEVKESARRAEDCLQL